MNKRDNSKAARAARIAALEHIQPVGTSWANIAKKRKPTQGKRRIRKSKPTKDILLEVYAPSRSYYKRPCSTRCVFDVATNK